MAQLTHMEFRYIKVFMITNSLFWFCFTGIWSNLTAMWIRNFGDAEIRGRTQNFRAKIFIVVSTSKWTYITFTGTKEFPIILETTVSLEDPAIF